MHVGGAASQLDELGPVIINEDGSIRRITNWNKLSQFEQNNTMRIIGKRNQRRRAKLEAARGKASDVVPSSTEIPAGPDGDL